MGLAIWVAEHINEALGGKTLPRDKEIDDRPVIEGIVPPFPESMESGDEAGGAEEANP